MLRLNPFAELCSIAILRIFPQWQKYVVSIAKEKRPHHPNDDDLVIAIPSSFRADGKPLFIHTDSDFDYLIVAFGPGWAEFADWHEDRGVEGIVKDAVECAKAIMEEKLVGVRLGRGWGLFKPEQLSKYNDVCQIVSWKGTFDFHRDE
ncbi:MAG: hypothetical protein IT426_19750 [Pirellulales bacterium]|nr:hypothetical protein [Pirellulales bacterium]